MTKLVASDDIERKCLDKGVATGAQKYLYVVHDNMCENPHSEYNAITVVLCLRQCGVMVFENKQYFDD